MKFLIDGMVTAKPDRCSSVIQNATFVASMLKKRDDVFFYWLLPDYVKEDMDFFPNDPRIQYEFFPAHKDRTNQYIEYSKEMSDMISFYGRLWDWDVLITNKTGLVPIYKLAGSAPKQRAQRWSREVWLVENMPLMTFKSSVAQIHPVQDNYTLNGYMCADKVMVMSFHEKEGILQAARDVYRPSKVLTLDNKIKPVIPTQIRSMTLKDVEKMWDGKGKFTCAFSGRVVPTGGNLDAVYGSMLKNWVLGDDIELVVLTVTKEITKPPPSQFHVKQLPREEFWDTLKKDVHVIINMHSEAGFLLSIMEPILQFGVPAIIIKKPWSVAQLGERYPFYVNTEAECYHLLREFYLNYEHMYSLFKDYCTDYLWPRYEIAFENQVVYDVMEGYLNDFEANCKEKWKEQEHRSTTEILTNLMAIGGTEIVFEDVVRKLGKLGFFQTMAYKTKRRLDGYIGTNWQIPLNFYRNMLKHFYGYEDASVKTGHLIKS